MPEPSGEVKQKGTRMAAILFEGDPRKVMENVPSNAMGLALSWQIPEKFEEGVVWGKKVNFLLMSPQPSFVRLS